MINYEKLLTDKKVLVVDIETAPNIGFFWRPGYNQTITHEQIIKERQIIMIGYNWIGEDKVHIVDWGLKKQDDRDLLKKIQPVLANASVIVGQNSKKFDLPWIQGRLAHHELTAIPTKLNRVELDTMLLARGNLGLNSYKLDYMSKFLGGDGKIPTHYNLWKDIILKKDKKAFEEMKEYLTVDVLECKKVLMKQLPYVDIPIHLGRLINPELDRKVACPKCAGVKRWVRGYRLLRSGVRYAQVQCQNCGHYYKSDIKV